VLASACFSPDAPPLGTDTVATESGTSGTLDGDTSTTGGSTMEPGTSSGDPTADSGSSDGTPGGCGDGSIGAGEACDDGNVENGDGCSDACAEEPGYQCVGAPSTCTAVCGDGIVVGDEACDDDNTEDGDGCTACMVDDGFECTGMPSVCASACGDGRVTGAEGCDDGGNVSGDGCTADCSVELYYRCDGAGPGSCAPIRILYVPADSDDPAFRRSVSAITGGPVAFLDGQANTPTLAQLQASHDCVFTHPNFSYADATGLGDVLAAFVDGGGNVVLGIATDYTEPIGLASSMIMTEAYSPVTTAGIVDFLNVTYAGDGTSAIHTGIATYGMAIYDTSVVLQGAGIQDATYDNGTISVAYRPDSKVVYLNGTGGTSLAGPGDWPLLVANACAVGFYGGR
jgi:cysteine-rich repeat protein